MYIAAPHVRAVAGRHSDSAPAVWQLDVEICAGYVALSDGELEQWFLRHRVELTNLETFDVGPIALWLPAIGPPANDNAHPRFLCP